MRGQNENKKRASAWLTLLKKTSERGWLRSELPNQFVLPKLKCLVITRLFEGR